MSTLSALRLGNRVVVRDPNVRPFPPFNHVLVRTVGTIVQHDERRDSDPWIVQFYELFGGVPAGRVAFSADQLRRMPTHGDYVEIITTGKVGRVIGVSYDSISGNDAHYSISVAGIREIRKPEEIRVIEECASIRSARPSVWRWIDRTYHVGKLRDKRTGWTLALEWKPADLWVGLFTAPKDGRRHVWLAFLTLVLHVWRGDPGA